jgi:2-keto-3-deoxy-galactonokinase
MSGLLIGSDVSSAINSTEWDLKNGSDIYIIGSNQLAQNFSEALNLAQIPTTLINSQQATLNGFAEVYRLHNQA